MSINLRNYEAFYIVKPDLSDADVQKVADRFAAVVTDKGGTVEAAGKWDKRKLAYEVAGYKEGTYILMNFSAAADVPAELNRLMRISDDVIRQVILAVELPTAVPDKAPASAKTSAVEPEKELPAPADAEPELEVAPAVEAVVSTE